MLLAGCGRYADFALPAPDAAGPKAPFAWSADPSPVLDRGEMSDVLNPSVVQFHGEYLNLYSEFDGKTWHTALAVSLTGTNWRKQGRVLSPSGWEGNYIAANGSALAAGDEILYWYEAGDPFRIALARSRDGVSWTRHGDAVLAPGPAGSFDERGVSDPDVLRAGGSFYMFYTGIDRARRQRLGLARSRDGVVWDKLRSNPILEPGSPGAFDEMGLGEPAVWSSGGSYWMLYTGRARGERRRIGLARSRDGVQWERDPAFPPIAGSEPWDREVVCDPSVEVTPDAIRVWFGGGDIARPDENLHGQIGAGWLHPK
ncbi:MAG TPA: hypothetical protein VKX39_18000 [Bryobacteraceae bacterium]|nr:hypothetical protein [Bryobacteraceae bacterium]